MKKRIFSWILCMLAVMSISVLGTMAYLTDEDSAVNTFTVGQVDIRLDEAKVNEQGQPVKVRDDGTEEVVDKVEDAARVQENKYHLIPGVSYVKDPTVTVVKDSEDSYVRILVTLNFAKELKEIFGTEFLPQDYVEGWDSTVWECIKISDNTDSTDETANTITYEFRYRDKVETAEIVEKGTEGKDTKLQPLFTGFTVPGTLTGDQLAKLVTRDSDGKITDQFKITVIGHAIQAAGFEADTENNQTAEDVAWEAFDRQIANAATP